MSSPSSTDQFPIRSFARWIRWAVYAASPSGRRERHILKRPDVQEALRQAEVEYREWKASL